MDPHIKRDIRDMAREAKFQTQLLTQQGNNTSTTRAILEIVAPQRDCILFFVWLVSTRAYSCVSFCLGFSDIIAFERHQKAGKDFQTNQSNPSLFVW